MNYLTEIIAFNQFAQRSQISDKAQLLWYGLMAINNECGWPVWFTAPLMRLMPMVHSTSNQTIYHARQELVDLGLLEVKKGHRGQAAAYHLIPFEGRYFGPGHATLIKRNDTKANVQSIQSQQQLSEPIPMFKLRPDKRFQDADRPTPAVK